MVVVDDSPTLDLDANNSSGALGANYVRTFTEGGGSVRIADVDATLADNDSANLASLTVTITNLLDGVDEVLTANTAGTSITATYVPGSGVLTLNGADTVANYQTVLRTVRYENLSDAPNTPAAVITFVASDGGSASNVGTAHGHDRRGQRRPDRDIAAAALRRDGERPARRCTARASRSPTSTRCRRRSSPCTSLDLGPPQRDRGHDRRRHLRIRLARR